MIKIIIVIILIIILFTILFYKFKLYGNGYCYNYDPITNKWKYINTSKSNTKNKIITNWKSLTNIKIKDKKPIIDLTKNEGIGIISGNDCMSKAYFTSTCDNLLTSLKEQIPKLKYIIGIESNVNKTYNNFDYKFIYNNNNIIKEHYTSMGIIRTICNDYNIFIDYEANEKYEQKHCIKSTYTDIVFASNVINSIFSKQSKLILIISFNEHAFKLKEEDYYHNMNYINQYAELLKTIITEFNIFKQNNPELVGAYFITITYIPKNKNEFELFYTYKSINNTIKNIDEMNIDFNDILLYKDIVTVNFNLKLFNFDMTNKPIYKINIDKKLMYDIYEIRKEIHKYIYKTNFPILYENGNKKYEPELYNLINNRKYGKIYYEISKPNTHKAKFVDGFVAINVE